MSLLTNEQMQRAQWLNLYYHRRLRWQLPEGFPPHYASQAFAESVAKAQQQANLTVDGILGPQTWAVIQKRASAPATSYHLIVNGQQVAVPFPVITFDQPEGMSFHDQPSWRRRKEPSGKGVNLLVLHWDGCHSSRQCFHTLLERQLSVHLLLDGDGTVYQALDLAQAAAWHAKGFNERSIGIEIQNPVFAMGSEKGRAIITGPCPHTGQIHTHFDFTNAQKERIRRLATAVCDIFDIPHQLPRDHADQILASLAPPSFSGVCGHYHVARNKIDPGMSLWEDLVNL